MPESDDHNEETVVFDRVDNAVVADSDSKAFSTAEGFCSGRSRIGGQECNRASNARLVLSVYTLQRTKSSGTNLDLISHVSRSPAEVCFDLIPRDVRALFGHGCIKSCDILSFLVSFHQAMVFRRADDDSLCFTPAFYEYGFVLSRLDDVCETLPCF